MKYLKLFVFILVLLLLSNVANNSITAQDNPDSCTDVVQVAVDAAALLCDNIGRHEACYGNALVEAEIQSNNEDSLFNTPGDLVNITALQSLRLSPLNIDENSWGVVEMSLQANIPASLPENITLVIFGDVSLTSATSTTAQTVEVMPNQSTIDVYAEPWILAEVIGELSDDQNAFAQGRTEDGEWLQISLPSTGDFGWIETDSVETIDDLSTLVVIDPDLSFQSPMQAFYFENGTNEACSAFPTDGLLIQTPEGIGQVNLLINEVDIQLGSTAFLQAQPDDMMRFVLLEGHARVTAESMSYDLLPGMMTEIPMDADMHASGSPSEPVLYDLQGLENLPLQLLDRQFVMGSPPSDDDASAASIPTDTADTPSDSSDTGSNNTANTTVGDTGDDGDSNATTPPTDPPTESPPTETPPPDTVTICHNGNTITVDWNSWINGHSKHGDTLGACP